MKSLNQLIQEKILINKDTKITDETNKPEGKKYYEISTGETYEKFPIILYIHGHGNFRCEFMTTKVDNTNNVIYNFYLGSGSWVCSMDYKQMCFIFDDRKIISTDTLFGLCNIGLNN